MRKFRKFASKAVAFTMAAALTFSGSLDNFSLLSKMSLSGAADVQAAVEGIATENLLAGTQNADKFSWDNATVYFLLTDRFVNGNTSNDNAYGRQNYKFGDTRATFHGGDFAGITQKINEGYFDDLGVNAIWLSAPYEQIHGYIQGGPSYYHQSYHGYYVLDYTETDAAFGTKEEFKTLVDTAHEHGIRIVMDIVMNHAGYSSIGDMDEFDYGTLKSGWKEFYDESSESKYSTYHNYVDYETSESDWAKWWGSDWIRSGLPGYSEQPGSDLTNSLSGLPDFKTESTTTVGIPELLKNKWTKEGTYSEKLAKYGSSGTVRSYLCKWLSEWVETYGVDGFRCDTAKHVEKESWKALKDSCVAALKTWRKNNPTAPGADWTDDFWMTGEAWDHGVGKDSYYTEGGFDSMINFSTCGGGGLASSGLAGTYAGYASQINTDPSFNVLSFMSSHDEMVMGASNGTAQMIYYGSAFLMLPGAVQIYYGDETRRGLVPGVSGDGYGGAGHSLRSDMNWDSIDEEVLAHWQKVGTFRNQHVAVGAGDNKALTATSGVAFARTYSKGDVSDRIAGVVGANADTSVTIDLGGVWSDGEAVMNYYDGSIAVVSGGSVTFNSGANGTILICDKGDGPLVSITGEAKFTGTQKVKVNIEQADYAIISIDGGHKFKAVDGDEFEIGSTGYEGDTITVSYTGYGEKGTASGKAVFTKNSSGGSGVPIEQTAKVHVKTADGSAPYLYAWIEGATATKLNGDWPGKLMSQKDDEGYYVVEFPEVTGEYSVIFNNGSDAKKTGDLTGNKGEVWYELDSSYKATKKAAVESKFGKMKEAARQSLILTSSDYTAASWSNFATLAQSAKTLIDEGEAAADATAVNEMYDKLVAAQSALVLAAPSISNSAAGGKTISGKAAAGATVTVVYSGKTYTANADELTGIWTVTTDSTLATGLTFTIKATYNGISSDTQTKNVGDSGGEIIVVPEVSITSQPQSVTASVGDKATFTVVASGTGLTYQWQVSSNNGQSWANSTVVKNSYSTTVSESKNGYQYRCVVTDSAGNKATSNAATLTVKINTGNISITTQPKSVVVAAGNKATFSVVASGTGLSYQWQVSSNGGKSWANSTVVKNSYSTTVSDSKNGYQYRCVVSDSTGAKVTSSAATLTVGTSTNITIISQPKNVTTSVGNKAAFSVAASGTGLKYQWQISSNGGKSWANSTVAKNSYSTTVTASKDGYKYRCVITDADGGQIVSMPATLKVGAALTFTTQPKSVSVSAGQKATFTVVASGTGLTYQWQVSSNGGKSWADSTVVKSSYSTTATASKNGYQYRCIVTDSTGATGISSAATLTVQ